MSVLFLRAQASCRSSFRRGRHRDPGWDIVLETDLDVEKMLDLDYGRCRLSVAVPEATGITSARHPRRLQVAVVPAHVGKFFRSWAGGRHHHGVGAAEVTPHLGMADLIVDLVSSGSTLNQQAGRGRGHRRSQAVLVASRRAWLPGEGDEELAAAIGRAGRRRQAISHGRRSDRCPGRSEELPPGVAGPTIMNIAGRDDIVAVRRRGQGRDL